MALIFFAEPRGVGRISYLPMIGTAVGVPLALAAVGYALAVRTRQEQDFHTPFECGFDPKHSARTPFSLRFFLLAIIFVLFDVEVALLLPLPFLPTIHRQGAALLRLATFIVLLLGGLFYEWRCGALE